MCVCVCVFVGFACQTYAAKTRSQVCRLMIKVIAKLCHGAHARPGNAAVTNAPWVAGEKRRAANSAARLQRDDIAIRLVAREVPNFMENRFSGRPCKVISSPFWFSHT